MSRARDELEAARTLSRDPELDAALRSGGLSPSQAALIADAVRVDPEAGSRLLKRAKRDPVRRLREECELTKAAPGVARRRRTGGHLREGRFGDGRIRAWTT